MIKSGHECRITKREIREFEAAIAALLKQGLDQDTDDALFRRCQVEAMRSQLADLADEVEAYEIRVGRSDQMHRPPPAKAVS